LLKENKIKFKELYFNSTKEKDWVGFLSELDKFNVYGTHVSINFNISGSQSVQMFNVKLPFEFDKKSITMIDSNFNGFSNLKFSEIKSIETCDVHGKSLIITLKSGVIIDVSLKAGN